MKDAKTLLEDKLLNTKQQLQNAEETLQALHNAIESLNRQSIEMKAVVTALEDLWDQIDLQEEIAAELSRPDQSSPSHQSSTSEPNTEPNTHRTN